MMKQSTDRSLFVLFLLVCLAATLTACGSSMETDGDADADVDEETEIPHADGDLDMEQDDDIELADTKPIDGDDDPESAEDGDAEAEEGEEEIEVVEIDFPDAEEPEWDFEFPIIERCVPGQRVCLANKLKICNGDGRSWSRELCEANEICVLDACEEVICEPGEERCDAGNVIRCNSEGVRYDIEKICRPPETCLEATCVSVCDLAIPIRKDQLLQGDTRGKANAVQTMSSCWTDSVGAPTIGPDEVYAIELSQGEAVRIKVTPLTRHFDSAVYVFSDCERLPDSCLGGADACCALTPDEFSFTAPADGTFFIAVDSWENNGGEYTIKVSPTQPKDADVSASNLRIQQIDEEELVLLAAVANHGPQTVDVLRVGIYLFSTETPSAGDLPFREVAYLNLAPGNSRTAAFRFPDPPKGSYNVFVAADWNYHFHDPNRANNIAGPLAFDHPSGVNETLLTPPESQGGRIQFIGEKSYYRFPCREGRTHLLQVSMEPDISGLDARLTLYGADDETVLELADDDGAGRSERILHVCREDGWVRLSVAASPGAGITERTGSFEVTAATLSEVSVLPEEMNVFPGRSARIQVQGRFDPLPEDATTALQDATLFSSLNPSLVTVSDDGTVTASASGEGTAFVVVSPKDPTVSSTTVTVRVSSVISGEIYPSADTFPMDIPDNSPVGVESTVEVTEDIALAQVAVGLSITHAKVQQLSVVLTSPLGTSVTLTNGDISGSNLVTVFGALLDAYGPGSLTDFIGESAVGTWTLHVSDGQAGQSGRLNTWRLYLVSDDEEPVESP